MTEGRYEVVNSASIPSRTGQQLEIARAERRSEPFVESAAIPPDAAIMVENPKPIYDHRFIRLGE